MLFIEPVELLSGGNYTCVVKNRAGLDSYTTFLDVEAPPKWVQTIGDGKIAYGSEAKLQCQASGSPVPTVRWQRFDEASQTWLTFNAVGESLVIPRVTLNETGRYRCSADNGVSPSVEHTLTVAVYVPPKIISFHFRKTIKPGENARTTCLVEAGDAPMTFSWLRNGVAASLTKNVHIQSYADHSILNVNPADATSAGNFTCIVKNKAGFDSFTAYLDIEGKLAPKVQPFQFRKTTKPGETVKTTCFAEAGDPPLTFSWLRNGLDVSSLKNVQIKSHAEVSLLTISPVDASSTGNFTCIIKNRAGFDSFTSLLEVEAPPEWKREPADKTGVLGSDVDIDCYGTGSPAPKITWHHVKEDGVERPIDEILQSRAVTYLNGTLRLHKLEVGDSGSYTCTADNGVPPVLKKTVSLKIHGKSVQQHHSIVHPNGTLVLSYLGIDDMGQYVCEADNGVKPSLEKIITIRVNAAPTWKTLASDKAVVWNETLHLDCPAVGYPKPQLSFKKKSANGGGQEWVQITETDRHTIHQNGTIIIRRTVLADAGSYLCEAHNGVTPNARHIVRIVVNEPVEISNAGNYTCIAKNRAGFDSFTAYLDVQVTAEVPKVQPFMFPPTVKPGSRVSAVCSTTSGGSQVTLSWLKDGKDIGNTRNVVVDTKRVLSNILIEPVEISNAGNYTCIAKNRAGFDSFTAFLDVQDIEARWIDLISSGAVRANDNGTLILEDVTTTDAGQYLCEADNGVAPTATLTFSISVNVSAEVPRLQPFTFPSDVKPGSRISTHCLTSSGGSEVALSWLKDGRDVGDTKNVFVETNKGLSTILIDPVDISNAGNYTCIAKNRAGFDSFTAILDVEDSEARWKELESSNLLKVYENGTLVFEEVSTADEGHYSCKADNGVAPPTTLAFFIAVNGAPPKIRPFSFPKVVSKGEKISVMCLVSEGTPPFSFSWFKGSGELASVGNVRITADVDYSVAVINPIDVKSAGNYTCIVKNIHGFDSFSSLLEVEAPPFFKKTSPDTDVIQGNSVTLTCHATGSPQPRIEWTRTIGHSDKPEDVRRSHRAQSLPNGTLIIEDVADEDEGKYTCTANNGIGTVSHSLFMHVRVAPSIQIFASSEVKAGDKVTATCVLKTGSQPLVFLWLKDGKEVSSLPNVKVKSAEDFSFLIINPADVHSSGQYTCVVKNAAGTDSRTVQIDVEAPPQWQRVAGDTEVGLGATKSFECIALGSPKPRVTWSKRTDRPIITPFSFPTDLSEGVSVQVLCAISKGTLPVYFTWLKDGKTLRETRAKITTADKFSVVQIDAVAPADVGNYTCFAKNLQGTDSHSSMLEVRAPPRWLREPSDVSALLGSQAVLSCPVAGYPAPKVTWSRITDGEPPVRLESSQSLTPAEDGTLVFREVSLPDRGTYLCEANNGVGGAITNRVRLLLNVPARFEEKAAVVTARRTEVTRMRCQATGDQPLSISWAKGSVKLDKRTSARYEVFETLTTDGLLSELVIRDTDRSDGALYTCNAENKYGKDDRKVKLIVQEVPGPPQDVRIRDVWSRSASVSWSASYNGNSPISKYIVQYWRDHGTAHRLQELELIGSTTWAMVRELLPGTAYVLNLVAENAIGRGESSRTVVFHTGEEEPEAAPVDILVEMKGPSTALISWKAPPREHWNGNLQGYYIGYRPRDDADSPFSFRRVEASSNVSHEYLLGGLQRGTEYALVLRAYNSAGSGPASQEKTVKTLDGDVPEAPRLFVTGVSTDSMTLRWVLRSSSDVTGYNLHYRQEGGTWLELPIVNTANNAYTLTNLHSGSVYQVYVTASNVLGRGDPSAILMVQTEKTVSGYESSAMENQDSDDGVPLYLDMALIIPAAAICLAVLVILISACICVRKMKSTPRPVPEILRYDPSSLNTETMMSQRYVEMEKMSDNDVVMVAPYDGSTMRNGTELRGTSDRQEMKTYVPKPSTLNHQKSQLKPVQNPMKDRPLPHPEQSPLRMDDSYYDSAQ
ncbi:hypothetical protein ISCGN_012205 [Ixodes scapularis]